MNIIDIIIKKRDSQELNEEEIKYFIENLVKNNIPDYQTSALLMAMFINKLSNKEASILANHMALSGDIVDLSKIDGYKVDKHSTGGVGDKTSLVVAPLIASCGINICKASGRGLSFTGGTIDKLESIPGFNVNLTEEEFVNNIKKSHIAITAQTKNLTPADKILYQLRDVTGTVESKSLIAASIMSKKLASNADGIVLDVKVGSGAFMKTLSDAKELATLMCNIGKLNNKEVVAILSNMDYPLGYAIGNSLEVIEAINTLKGNGSSNLKELSFEICKNMLIISKKCKTDKEAYKLLEEKIKSNEAFNKFVEFVKNQGGDISYLEDINKFPKSKYIIEYKSKKDGYISKIDANILGKLTVTLGGGRLKKDDKIDHSVGFVLNKSICDFVKKDDILLYIHTNYNDNRLDDVIHALDDCFKIEKEMPSKSKLILGTITV